jgi:hypothetical protein
MAVVDDVQRGRLVVEANGRQLGFLRITNVNGGLVVSDFTGGKFGSVAPWFGPRPPYPSGWICVLGEARGR